MRVVIGLLNEREFFSLRLIQSGLHTVCFFKSLQTQHKKLGVVFVIQRREWYVLEFAGLQPMEDLCVDSSRFFSSQVGTILKIVMLSFLLSFEI